MRNAAYGYWHLLLAAAFLAFLSLPGSLASARPSVLVPPQRLILAHYMPWYAAPPASASWGWHWTMEHFNPQIQVEGKREIASHYYPLIGPYDSGDPHVLEYHLLLMRLAGIDGVIIDWYGRTDHLDYALLHRNTERLVKVVQRLKMKFAICYEDSTIPRLAAAGKLQDGSRVQHATEEIRWLAKHWLHLPGYVKADGKPLLLSFGHAGLTDLEWSESLKRVAENGPPITYLSEHHRRRSAMGAFDWPQPQRGLAAIDRFTRESSDWPIALPIAYPRFVDIYEQARVHPSHGNINDDNGATFKRSLTQALASKHRIIQLATWNDWGEGTQIEPSQEYGYRDLQFLQQARRKYIQPRFGPQAADLKLPGQLLAARRAAQNAQREQQLDEIALLLAGEKVAEARARLQSVP